ncbi:hypothetical protein [Streptomyces sp. NPDC001508]|uniref:hypothetical protein n=1 Tax=Streptomyces sp. NPDC001508 TaxID=3154656 RepID=UPI003317E379
MHTVDLAAEVAQLRQLGSDFEQRHSQVRSLALTPGTEARRQLTTQIAATNDLTRRVMERLATLDCSQYSQIPGSRPALDALASLVESAALAAADLASALAANPLEGAPFAGPPTDEAAVRQARDSSAAPAMAEHVADAAHQLDLCFTGCYYLASGITQDLKRHAERNEAAAAAKLTDSQYDVLARLSSGGGALAERGRMGVSKAHDKNGTPVNLRTLRSLIGQELVTVDTATSLYHGQRLDLTAKGKQALAQHKRATAPTETRAVAPSVQKQAHRRTR